MPDVWTINPDDLRTMLTKHEGNIKCGAEPRVLKNRDPDWTCVMDWREGDIYWKGDIYIHNALNPWGGETASPFALLLLLSMTAAFLAGTLLGIRCGRRSAS